MNTLRGNIASGPPPRDPIRGNTFRDCTTTPRRNHPDLVDCIAGALVLVLSLLGWLIVLPLLVGR
jgi:hypothetical protein